jgi:hypothetical protein
MPWLPHSLHPSLCTSHLLKRCVLSFPQCGHTEHFPLPFCNMRGGKQGQIQTLTLFQVKRILIGGYTKFGQYPFMFIAWQEFFWGLCVWFLNTPLIPISITVYLCQVTEQWILNKWAATFSYPGSSLNRETAWHIGEDGGDEGSREEAKVYSFWHKESDLCLIFLPMHVRGVK